YNQNFITSLVAWCATAVIKKYSLRMCIDNAFKSWNEVRISVFTQAWRKIQGIKCCNNEITESNKLSLLKSLQNLEINVELDDLPEFININTNTVREDFSDIESDQETHILESLDSINDTISKLKNVPTIISKSEMDTLLRIRKKLIDNIE
ncbi:hypothetical protein A3Q56_07983, partial [Intoshia linei]